MKKETTFFTIGEMASLFSISRQTLLYYDKIGLLAPEYLLPNGYRCYTIQQYMDLEIIVNLRSLGLSLSTIHHYLQNRSKSQLRHILEEKIKDCTDQIACLERQKKEAFHVATTLAVSYDDRLHRPLLTYKEKQRYRLAHLSSSLSGKERVALFAKHTHRTIHNKGIWEKKTGWVLDGTALFTDAPTFTSKAYFSYAPDVPGHPEYEKYDLPAGLYVEYYFKGPFGTTFTPHIKKLTAFLQSNNITPIGPVFIMPLENHWVTKQADSYVSYLFFPVKENKKST